MHCSITFTISCFMEISDEGNTRRGYTRDRRNVLRVSTQKQRRANKVLTDFSRYPSPTQSFLDTNLKVVPSTSQAVLDIHVQHLKQRPTFGLCCHSPQCLCTSLCQSRKFISWISSLPLQSLFLHQRRQFKVKSKTKKSK